MHKGWETVKGDEWWYKSCYLESEAMFSANILSIETIKFYSGQIIGSQFHAFLWLTQSEFIESKITLYLNPQVEAVLRSLQESEKIRYSVLSSSHSRQAKIEMVSEPKAITQEVVIKSKKWWHLW